MDFRLIIHKNALFLPCPKCKEEMSLDRMKSKNKFEKIFLTIIRFKKYHCKSCKWNGKIFIYTITRNIKKVLLNYLITFILLLIISFLGSFIIKLLFNP